MAHAQASPSFSREGFAANRHCKQNQCESPARHRDERHLKTVTFVVSFATEGCIGIVSICVKPKSGRKGVAETVFIRKKGHLMTNKLTFLAACSYANGTSHRRCDEIRLPSEHPERLERGNYADPNIDYDPLRLMRRSDAKPVPHKDFSARFGGL